ncbi:MAG: acylphosphatase [Bacteroidales bacterium]
MENLLHYSIRVTGMVQGVGFRWTAASEARHLKLKGYVKNMPDGSVYIEAEGDREKLDQFIEWCRTGPRYGYVESVDIGTLPPAHFKEFTIEH